MKIRIHTERSTGDHEYLYWSGNREMEFESVEDALAFGLHNCGLIYSHKGTHPRHGHTERCALVDFRDENGHTVRTALLMGNGYEAIPILGTLADRLINGETRYETWMVEHGSNLVSS